MRRTTNPNSSGLVQEGEKEKEETRERKGNTEIMN